MRFINGDIIYPITKAPIQGGVIVMDNKGEIVDLLSTDEGIENGNIERHSGIIVPGFINAHCHLELSHLKEQIPEKTGIVDFAGHVISKRNQASEEQKQEAMRLADLEMQNSGIAAVGDISNDITSLLIKKKSKIYYHTFIELIGFNPANAEKIFDTGKALRENFKAEGLPTTLAPHAPYSVSSELLRMIAQEKDEKSFSIHNQESIAENEFFEKGTGDFLRLYQTLGLNIDYHKPSNKSSLQSYLEHLVSSKNLALVHNTFSSFEDVSYAENLSRNLFWCLCPAANLYIEQSLPDVPLLMRNNCKIILGTDSLASNHLLSVMNEINIIRAKYSEIELQAALRWATLNGAEFLGIQNQYGSIEQGKKPGLVLLKNDKKLEVQKVL